MWEENVDYQLAQHHQAEMRAARHRQRLSQLPENKPGRQASIWQVRFAPKALMAKLESVLAIYLYKKEATGHDG